VRIELQVIGEQYLKRHIATIGEIRSEVEAWKNHRKSKTARINWQFRNDQACIKIK